MTRRKMAEQGEVFARMATFGYDQRDRNVHEEDIPFAITNAIVNLLHYGQQNGIRDFDPIFDRARVHFDHELRFDLNEEVQP